MQKGLLRNVYVVKSLKIRPSPSGKALGFGPSIRRFESYRPSQEIRERPAGSLFNFLHNSLILRNIKAKSMILPPKGRSDMIQSQDYHITELPKYSELCSKSHFSLTTFLYLSFFRLSIFLAINAVHRLDDHKDYPCDN